MTDRAPLTMEVARFCADTTFADLPDEVVHHTKRVILDYLAATIPGAESGAARIVRDLALATDTDRSATVIGTALRLSAANAAAVNGTAAHGLEIDDGYTKGSFHPGAPILSAVLAAAEANAASGDDTIVAAALGYEIGCRLAQAGHPATWQRGFHNTPVAGVFGAAAAVSRLLGSDAELTANALGLAGSHAGGLFEFLGQSAEVKRYHAGKAARDGLLSAQLAAAGLTGPTTVLEGPHGYAHAFAGDDFDADGMVAGLGTDWRMRDSYVKPYPCCRHLHGPIDAVLALQQDGPIDIEAVESVTVETYPGAARHDLAEIHGLLDAQMSIPYAIGVTLLHGEPLLAHFEEPTRSDPRIARIVDLVEVGTAENCARDYPRMRPARVIVHAGGQERSLRIDQPYGEPSNPVTDADLEKKVVTYAGGVLGPDRCKRIIEETWRFDTPARLYEAIATTETP